MLALKWWGVVLGAWMLRVLALVVIVSGQGCELGATSRVEKDQRPVQGSYAVRLDVPSDAEVFGLDSRTGKLVRVGTALDIGQAAANPNMTALEYLSESQHWVWVGPVDQPRFVRSSVRAGSEPYADNPQHSYLEAHSVVEFAEAGLPRWAADAYGGCAEYQFNAQGRLQPAPIRMREPDLFGTEEFPRPDSVLYATSIGDYVMGSSLTFASTHCLRAHEQIGQRFALVPDARDRDAYVLGTGTRPLDDQQGAFLMLLAQQYRTVYVNDGGLPTRYGVPGQMERVCPRCVRSPLSDFAPLDGWGSALRSSG